MFFRAGINQLNPEGMAWQDIPTGEEEIQSLSVGPTGLVWAVTWAGSILVRLGVDWQNVRGEWRYTCEPHYAVQPQNEDRPWMTSN